MVSILQTKGRHFNSLSNVKLDIIARSRMFFFVLRALFVRVNLTKTSHFVRRELTIPCMGKVTVDVAQWALYVLMKECMCLAYALQALCAR
jgi:hypothetical protein